MPQPTPQKGQVVAIMRCRQVQLPYLLASARVFHAAGSFVARITANSQDREAA